MRKAPFLLMLILAAAAVLVMVNVATDTKAITANATAIGDASDPFMSLSEFDTSYNQASCTKCKAIIPCGATCENNPPCKCKTCNGTFDCWRPN